MKSKYPSDRFTVSVRQGYHDWLKRVCLELDTDVSKYVRAAVDEKFRSDYKAGKLSRKLLAELKGLKYAHGQGRGGL